MEKIWENKFKNKKVKFPNEIAIEYCNQLYELTNKMVIAKVEKYEKNIYDMDIAAPIANLAGVSTWLRTTKAEEYLGEISGSDRFTYELYLTGSNTPKYKYRFCFIENGVYPYPVKIIVDSDIAKELESETRINCESEIIYKETLIKILNSKKMNEVIEGLMTINSKINEK